MRAGAKAPTGATALVGAPSRFNKAMIFIYPYVIYLQANAWLWWAFGPTLYSLRAASQKYAEPTARRFINAPKIGANIPNVGKNTDFKAIKKIF